MRPQTGMVPFERKLAARGGVKEPKVSGHCIHFQVDNAPTHATESLKECLESHCLKEEIEKSPEWISVVESIHGDKFIQ